jgi:hypothetical protein
MIQRKQTIWLLLAAICSFLSFKLPFFIGDLIPTTVQPAVTAASHKLTGTENFGLILLTGVIALLALTTIFLFKQRVLQLRLCILGIIMEALLIFLYWHYVTSIFVPKTGAYAVTALLQGAVVFFFFIAARDINKDEKKVKDSDKLR